MPYGIFWVTTERMLTFPTGVIGGETKTFVESPRLWLFANLRHNLETGMNHLELIYSSSNYL